MFHVKQKRPPRAPIAQTVFLTKRQPMPPTPINLAAKFDLFDETWSPKIIAELNGQHVKIAKLQGAFDWHHHEHEDELFFVVRGQLTIQLRDGAVVLNAGEMAVIPRGTEHRPVAEDEVHVMLFEPASTLNTGNVRTERTREELDRL